MWMQKTANGKVRYFDEYKNIKGDLQVVSITLPDAKRSTQREAQRCLDAKKRANRPSPFLRFGEMVDKYKEFLAFQYKKQTATAAEFQFRPILRAIGYDREVRFITAELVRSTLYDGNDTKYNERLKHLKAAFRWAKSEGLVEDITFIGSLTKKRSTRRREALTAKYLEDYELKALLDGMKVEKWRLLTEFLVLSGLRIGEAIALTTKDIDLVRREISVTKTFSLNLKEVTETAKTETSNRVVFIQDELAECINRINAIMPHRRTVFFYDNGYVRYESFAKFFRENTEQIVGRRLSPHALRHTSVALLAAAGIQLDPIARRLGHVDSDITRDVYMHVTEKLKERDADALRSVRIVS